MTDEHWMMRLRRLVHEAVVEAAKLDPDNDGKAVRGWALVLDVQGIASPDDETLPEAVRGQPTAAMRVYSSDAVGDGDIAPHTVGGLLLYAGLHSDEYVLADDDGDDD